jgi:hypothetical protein
LGLESVRQARRPSEGSAPLAFDSLHGLRFMAAYRARKVRAMAVKACSTIALSARIGWSAGNQIVGRHPQE